MRRAKSIRKKITTMVLSVSLIALLALGAASTANILAVRSEITAANAELTEAASHDSASALEQETRSKLSNVTGYMAQLADEKLGRLVGHIQMLAGAATSIFSHPEAYAPRAVNPPLRENIGKLAVYFTRPGDVADEQVWEEAALAANCSEIMLEISSENSVLTCYVAAESGLHLVCDEATASRLADTYEGFDPRARSWYQNALQNGGLVFSDVVDDAQGRGLGIVCSAPYYNADGSVHGVVGLGALITEIDRLVLDTDFGQTGEAFLLNKNGEMIIGGGVTKDADGNLVRPNFYETGERDLREVVRWIRLGVTGLSQVRYQGRDVYMAYTPVHSAEWTLVTTIDVDEAMQLSANTAAKIAAAAETASHHIDRSIVYTLLIVLGVMVLTSCAVLFMSVRESKKLTDPIHELIEGVGHISNGDLQRTLSIRTGDEIESLADAYNRMTRELKDYIDHLAAVTKDKERIATELNVATQIQASMLPSIFPPFPNRGDVDLYATMQPAKEVGGDFYDFFLIDDRHLGVVIADVSGKGVPAALFMVIAKTLIKNHAQLGKGAAESFTAVNEQLCENNEAAMFVTAWFGILDLQSGRLSYANAGHNPPFLRRGGGRFECLRGRAGFVLAGMEGVRYREAEMVLRPGDRLYLYTDGVTEATSAAEEMFGEERLLRSLNRSGACPLNGLLRAVKQDIDAFVGDAPQFDDITMLVLEYKGPDGGSG